LKKYSKEILLVINSESATLNDLLDKNHKIGKKLHENGWTNDDILSIF